MSTANDVIAGALKLNGNIDCKCFKNWKDFVESMPSLFSVEVPSSVTNVVMGVDQPDADQQDCLWLRTDGSGSFVGLFIYAAGAWQQIYPAPRQIIRMWGSSVSVPAGFMLADENNPHITAAQAAFLKGQWYSPDGGITYSIFDVTYEGF